MSLAWQPDTPDTRSHPAAGVAVLDRQQIRSTLPLPMVWEMQLDSEALGYFVEGIAQAASTKHGVGLRSVKFVPWAWQSIGGRLNHYGWVIRLRDGRRIYLEYKVDKAGAGSPEALCVRPFPASEVVPELSDPNICWFEPRHVNTALSLGIRRDREADDSPSPALAKRLKRLAADLRRDLSEDPDALKLAVHIDAVATCVARRREPINLSPASRMAIAGHGAR
jgi:hypothetical protein